MHRTEQPTERAVLVAVLPQGHIPYESDPLAELESLADTAGVEIVYKTVQKRDKPHPATHIGKGKVEELNEVFRETSPKVDIVIFDSDLTPAQQANLEKALGRRVLDRTELVLDIFATHASTRKAHLQVELALLEYELPRLARMWTHLSRQAAGAGVGLRGPGEKQIEVDRRLARKRIADLKSEISKINARKRREVEKRGKNYTVALVGYTNAGKSSLMNKLTGSDVLAQDQLFSTLDTRTRNWVLPDGQHVLLSDTVGFIRNLPHHLVASFQATLEEVITADLLLHVVDASHPLALEHIESVRTVLKQLNADRIPEQVVLNKVDRLTDRVELAILQNAEQGALAVSAHSGEGLDQLCAGVINSMASMQVDLTLELNAGDGKRLAELADKGKILERTYEDENVIVEVRLPIREAEKWNRFITTASTDKSSGSVSPSE